MRGERTYHLALMVVVIGCVPFMQATQLAGEVSQGLAFSAFALSALRLLRPHWYAGALENSTVRAVEADEQATRAEHELHRRETQARTVDAAGRVLHDEVLSALRQVQEGRGDAEHVRAGCRRAVGSVRQIVSRP